MSCTLLRAGDKLTRLMITNIWYAILTSGKSTEMKKTKLDFHLNKMKTSSKIKKELNENSTEIKTNK